MDKLDKVFGLSMKGKISIAIDKPSYIAGELIHGTIHVSVPDPIQCDAIVLIATGKEKVTWEQTISQDFETEDFEREHELFEEKIILSQIPHTLQPGEYVHPFRYQLPLTLPGVFSLERYMCLGVRNLEATVKYKFKATLELDGFFAKDLKARTHVVVHEQLAQRIQPSQDSITQPIHWFCCLSRGKCTIAVAMDKNVYLPGETAQILCHITNDSRVNISSMRCHLYQDITLTLAFPEAQTFTRLIAEARFSGVLAGKSSSQSQPLRLVPTVEGGVINPSTSGTLVKCAYRIEIDCDIPWCPDVTLHLPLTINAPALPRILYITPPTAGYIVTRSEST